MKRLASFAVLLAAGLCGLGGCTRTYDGTLVPTYRIAVARYAGIPVLTMRRRPLSAPEAVRQSEPDAFPPQPAPPPEIAPPAPVEARARPASALKPHRTARRPTIRRAAAPPPAAAAQAAPTKPLLCREQKSATRAVSMSCE